MHINRQQVSLNKKRKAVSSLDHHSETESFFRSSSDSPVLSFRDNPSDERGSDRESFFFENQYYRNQAISIISHSGADADADMTDVESECEDISPLTSIDIVRTRKFSVYSTSESDAKDFLRTSQDEAIHSIFSDREDPVLVNKFSKQKALLALLDLAELSGDSKDTSTAAGRLLFALKHKDLPKEHDGEENKLTRNEVLALRRVGRALVPFSFKYNPVLSEAWEMSRTDERSMGENWKNTDVSSKSYVSAKASFSKSIQRVLLDIDISEVSLSMSQQKRLDLWKTGKFTYSNWVTGLTEKGFEKHHIAYKNILEKGSISSTNLVLLPQKLHQIKNDNEYGITSLHRLQDGKGNSKKIIFKRTKIIFKAMIKCGEANARMETLD